MELAWILFRQNVIMIIYMAIGFFLYKKKLVTKAGSGEMGKLLVYIIMPVIIIKAYIFKYFTMDLWCVCNDRG